MMLGSWLPHKSPNKHMKCNLPPRVVVRRGTTLIELTVIILVLL